MAVHRSNKKKRTSISDKRLAHKVLSRAEIRDVRLVQASVENRLPLGKKPKYVKLELETECGIGEHLDSKNELHIQVRFKVVASSVVSMDVSASAFMDFALLLVYSLTSIEGISEKNLHAFTKWIGFNNAWPYAREFVQSISTRFGLPHLSLPLYKVEDIDVVNEGAE